MIHRSRRNTHRRTGEQTRYFMSLKKREIFGGSIFTTLFKYGVKSLPYLKRLAPHLLPLLEKGISRGAEFLTAKTRGFFAPKDVKKPSTSISITKAKSTPKPPSSTAASAEAELLGLGTAKKKRKTKAKPKSKAKPKPRNSTKKKKAKSTIKRILKRKK